MVRCKDCPQVAQASVTVNRVDTGLGPAYISMCRIDNGVVDPWTPRECGYFNTTVLPLVTTKLGEEG